MSEAGKSLRQTIAFHLGNGRDILRARGSGALFGAAMVELTKLIDEQAGPRLSPAQALCRAPALLREHGLRKTVAAVARDLGFRYFEQALLPPELGGPPRQPQWHYTYELTKPDGVVPSRRIGDEYDYALETPFRYTPGLKRTRPVAAIVHVFYPEVLPLILTSLANVPVGVDLFLSTNAEEKREQIAEHVAPWSKGSIDIRVLPNRGRDIGAKFVGFRDVYDRYDLFIHLHTKKSPHGGNALANWCDFLINALIGDVATSASALSLFDDPKVGVVFPQHLFELRGILNWGYDYDLARGLLRRMGVNLNKNLPLEFPSGSMFWARSEAIRPLLDLGLSYDDFPEEGAQVDGTLAHAIERIVLMVAESRGFEWLKVCRRDAYPVAETILPVSEGTDIARHRLKVFQPSLSGVDIGWPVFANAFKSARPVPPYPSRNSRPRFNLIVPTVNPHQIFGGVSTALILFEQIATLLGPDVDKRIIVTDAAIDATSVSSMKGYSLTGFAPFDDSARATLVDVSARDGRLELRAGDIFMATAWWTATLCNQLEQDQRRFFGGQRKFVYLIQDDEPYFYGWSSEFALAEATYKRPERTIAIINSHELYAELVSKYTFAHTFCLPWKLSEAVDAHIRPAPREPIILVYARPSIARNLYGLVCAGLFLWQQRDPIRASRWQILFAGEAFDQFYVDPLMNVTVAGKLDLATYGDWLSRASVGISLMASPHPSYPPLEMASAGLRTITNTWTGKDLQSRFPDIVSLNLIEPETIAEAIERCVAEMEPSIGTIAPRREPAQIPTPAPFDSGAVARLVAAQMTAHASEAI